MTYDLLDDVLPVEPHPDVDFTIPPLDLDALDRLIDRLEADRFARDPLHAAIAELRIRRSADHLTVNGQREHGYKTTCHGCGAEISVKRRPIPGKRSWCPECVQNGEPAADRARRYRERKRQA